MLILTRKIDQSIIIQGNITIMVLGVERDREVVGVDRQADSDARAVRPRLRRQLSPGPDVMCRFPDLIIGPLEAWLILRGGLLCGE